MNLAQLRTLVAANLRLDLRNPRTGQRAASRMVLTVVSYGLSGMVLAFSMGAASPATIAFVAASFALVLTAFGVTGSYDELMGRPKDHAWMRTLPASEGTQYAARLAGIGVLVGLIALSFGAPLALAAGLQHGAGAGLATGGLVALATAWTAALSLAILWALTLHLPRRVLRPVLVTVRGLFIAALVLGYQGVSVGGDLLPTDAAWWPGTWLVDGSARPWSAPGALLGGSLAVVLALMAAYFPRRYFSLLDRIVAAERGRPAQEGARLAALERALTGNPVRRAAYGFTASALANDRLVRGRVWPAALLPLGFALFGVWQGALGDLFLYGPQALMGEPAVQFHVSVLVILLFCSQTLVQALQFSDDAAAAWVFDTLPGATPRPLQLGAQQALTVRVLVPVHLMLAAVLAGTMPLGHALLHAGFWLAASVLTTRLQALLQRRPPFARLSDRFGMAERFVPLVLSIPLALVFLTVQTLLFQTPALALQGLVGLFALAAAIPLVVDLRSRPRRAEAVRPAAVPEGA